MLFHLLCTFSISSVITFHLILGTNYCGITHDSLAKQTDVFAKLGLQLPRSLCCLCDPWHSGHAATGVSRGAMNNSLTTPMKWEGGHFFMVFPAGFSQQIAHKHREQIFVISGSWSSCGMNNTIIQHGRVSATKTSKEKGQMYKLPFQAQYPSGSSTDPEF